MKKIVETLILSVFALLAFTSAYAVVDGDSYIIGGGGGEMSVVKPLEGDTVDIQPCTSENFFYTSTDCGWCQQTPGTNCTSCRIQGKKYNCDGSIQIEDRINCVCQETSVSEPRNCVEEPVIAGTNPCGGNCSLCVQQVCTGGGLPDMRGYLCKSYSKCPYMNFKQYRASGCGTQERKCCLTDTGLDWTGWSSNAVCPTLGGDIDSEFDGDTTLNPGSGGGIKNNTIKG